MASRADCPGSGSCPLQVPDPSCWAAGIATSATRARSRGWGWGVGRWGVGPEGEGPEGEGPERQAQDRWQVQHKGTETGLMHSPGCGGGWGWGGGTAWEAVGGGLQRRGWAGEPVGQDWKPRGMDSGGWGLPGTGTCTPTLTLTCWSRTPAVSPPTSRRPSPHLLGPQGCSGARDRAVRGEPPPAAARGWEKLWGAVY